MPARSSVKKREGEFAYKVVSHSKYREMRNEDDRRQYNRNKQMESRSWSKVSLTSADCVPPSAQAESEAPSNTERGDTHARSNGMGDKDRGRLVFIQEMGAKIVDSHGTDLFPEWKAALKGLGREGAEAVFKQARPGILWPSEFKAHRKAMGV